ncbi:hypothetical protein L1987_22279 [Smallanthus sonchifolius]|uniref:Uncharacterized protein n=1 Tax=Smallanthus sonchifolius TaxID=185202 RepID=A0ACB9IE84_9ASTR|nr:hypothetical protein L1987_22279 [Smallanthus sonchifolius]
MDPTNPTAIAYARSHFISRQKSKNPVLLIHRKYAPPKPNFFLTSQSPAVHRRPFAAGNGSQLDLQLTNRSSPSFS